MSGIYVGSRYVSDADMKDIVYDSVSGLKRDLGVPVRFSRRKSADIGCVMTAESRIPIIMYKPQIRFEFREDPRFGFLHLVSAFGHEAQHVRQERSCRSGSCDPEILASMISVRGNNDFYYDNYFYNPVECDAEYNGLLYLRSCLMEHGFSESDAIAGCLCFMNERVGMGPYFGYRPCDCRSVPHFGNFDAVLDFFDDAYESCRSSYRLFYYNSIHRNSSDVLFRLIDGNSRMSFFDQRFGEAESGVECDRMIASLMLAVMPYVGNNYRKALCKHDLSVERVFGRGFPMSYMEAHDWIRGFRSRGIGCCTHGGVGAGSHAGAAARVLAEADAMLQHGSSQCDGLCF